MRRQPPQWPSRPRPPAPFQPLSQRAGAAPRPRRSITKAAQPQGVGTALAQLSVGLLTEGLRAAGVGAAAPAEAGATAAATLPAEQGRLRRGDVAGVLRTLRQDYERYQYFVTGVVSDAIYVEDCVFADPTVSFKGRELYKRNLKLLVPFLIEPRIQLKLLQRLPPQGGAAGGSASGLLGELQARLSDWLLGMGLGSSGVHSSSSESGSSGSSAEPVQLYAEWLLTCSVRLPWRPYVRVNGSTTYTLNPDRNQIVSHVEAWDISAVEALLLLLRPAGGRGGERGLAAWGGGARRR